MKRNALKLFMVLMIAGALSAGGCAGNDSSLTIITEESVDKSSDLVRDSADRFKDDAFHDNQIDGVESKSHDNTRDKKMPAKSSDDVISPSK